MLEMEISKGIDWILGVQNKDGGWGGPFKEYIWSGVWTTAGTLYVIARRVKEKSDKKILHAIFRGLKFVEKYQNEDGGFPRVQNDVSSTESTSFVLICAEELATLATSIELPSLLSIVSPILERTRRYITGAQRQDGSWEPWKGESDIARTIPTGFAIIALSKFNDKSLVDEYIEKGVERLVMNTNSEGGWGYTKGQASNPMATSVALLALASSDRYGNHKCISGAIEWLKDNVSNDSGWSAQEEMHIMKTNLLLTSKGESSLSVRDMIWRWFSSPFCIWALVANGESVLESQIHNAFQYLLSLQSENGGWSVTKGEDPIVWATYQALMCLYEIENNIDLKRDYQAITGLINNLKSYIQNLEGEPHIALKHKKLVEQFRKSSAIYIGNQGIYMSQKVFIFLFIFVLTLICVVSATIYYYPSFLIFLRTLAITYRKMSIGFLVGITGSLSIFAIYKIYNIRKHEAILAAIALWFSIILYIL